jgi:hypothetical protein
MDVPESPAYRIQHRETGMYLLREWGDEWALDRSRDWWVRNLSDSSRLSLDEARRLAVELRLNPNQYKICRR